MNKENSPFTPGNPVPVELFVGRENQIKEITRYLDQTASGKQENLFLAGDRGIGKSSLASFIRQYASTKKYPRSSCFLGGVHTLEEMVRHVFDQLLKEGKGQSLFENVSQLFGKHIQQLGLFGVSVSFAPSNKELKGLVRNFPEAINTLLEKIKGYKKGLLIILDCLFQGIL